MTLHLALKISDEARCAIVERALVNHGTVHGCESVPGLERAAAAGAAAAVFDVEALDALPRLRQAFPGLLLILAYDPAGDELADAVRLARRRLGAWFVSEPGDELAFLLGQASAGRIPSGPTPAELAMDCVAKLAPPGAARRFSWLNALNPASQRDEAAAAAGCGEKLRTVQRQFAEIGATAGGVRRAFQVLHASFWLRGRAAPTREIAAVYGRRSARALREAVRDVLGTGVRQLRRLEWGDAISAHLVHRLRRRRYDQDRRGGARAIRVGPRVSVTLRLGAVVARVEPQARWVLSEPAGTVLVELMRGRSLRQIVMRVQRDLGITRRAARAGVGAALDELSARGVLELGPD